MNKTIQMMFLLVVTVMLVGCSQQINNVFKSDINPDTGDPYTNQDLLIYTCLGDFETVKKLIDLGLDYNIDHTLDCAVDSNNLEFVQYLVDNGADITQQVDGEINLLMAAIQEGSYNLIEYFLQEGLDPYQFDGDGYQIFHHLIQDTDFDDRESVLSTLNIIELLQKYDVDMSTMEIGTGLGFSYMESPALYAIQIRNPLLLDLSLTLGMTLGLSYEDEQEFIKDFRYNASYSDRILGCLMYSKGNIPIFDTKPGTGYLDIEKHLPYCASSLAEYYEEYGFNDNGATSYLIDSTIPQELLEAEANFARQVQQKNEALQNQIDAERKAMEEAYAARAQEEADAAKAQEEADAAKAQEEADILKENSENIQSTTMTLTVEEAQAILQEAFPDYTYYSGGSLSEEEFHDGKSTTEPAYMFVFTDAIGDPYVGWVFSDGSYKLRATTWGD